VNVTIDFQDPHAPIPKTQAIQTKLIDPHDYLEVPSLMEKVQSFYEYIILFLFLNPQFLAVSWATNESELSGTGMSTTARQYSCVKSRMLDYFVYRSNIVVGYYAMILLTGVALFLGANGDRGKWGNLKMLGFPVLWHDEGTET
jgi:acyl-CoA thioesterase